MDGWMDGIILDRLVSSRFLPRVSTLTRDIIGILSVRLSVTFPYCIEAA